MLDVAEVYVRRGKNERNAATKEDIRRQVREECHQHGEVEPDAFLMQEDQHDDAECKEGEEEIHHRGEHVGDGEDLRRDARLGQEPVIRDETLQSCGGGIAEEIKYRETAQNEYGEIEPVSGMTIQEHGENERDDDHEKQGIQHGPNDAEDGIPIQIAYVTDHQRNGRIERTFCFDFLIDGLDILFLHVSP